MPRKNAKSGMWQYLDSVGVLEKGNDEEIRVAKRDYRKKYFLLYKQKQRLNKPEFTVCFSKENGEYDRIAIAAKKHKMPITAFLRLASLSYLTRTYIVPDRGQIARLEQYLSDCLNEVKTIVSTKERFFWDREQKLIAIEKRIERLEIQISEVFRNPPLLYNDHQHQIA